MTKYHASPTEVDGIRFHSKKEAARYKELKLLERAGAISNLQLQPKYPLVVEDVKIATYIGDFRYENKATGKMVHEDVKGVLTPVYKMKKKLLYALYGIEILET